MTADKQRLDVSVVDNGLAETRARAQALILGGGITVDGSPITKPATLVGSAAVIRLVNSPLPYVSRGGLKLRHALDAFEIEVTGCVAADIGASTGGFTDVLLRAGADRVYAIDVGYGQLAWTLRNDSRVTVMERTNVRYLESLPEQVDLTVIDVSFISLRLVLPVALRLLRPGGDVVCLVKPQFEAGSERVGRKGVVRDPHVWQDVLAMVLGSAIDQGWSVAGLERSPITGPAGNVEFLAHLALTDRSLADIPGAIAAITGVSATS